MLRFCTNVCWVLLKYFWLSRACDAATRTCQPCLILWKILAILTFFPHRRSFFTCFDFVLSTLAATLSKVSRYSLPPKRSQQCKRAPTSAAEGPSPRRSRRLSTVHSTLSTRSTLPTATETSSMATSQPWNLLVPWIHFTRTWSRRWFRLWLLRLPSSSPPSYEPNVRVQCFLLLRHCLLPRPKLARFRRRCNYLVDQPRIWFMGP